jgi:hypothetical protein
VNPLRRNAAMYGSFSHPSEQAPHGTPPTLHCGFCGPTGVTAVGVVGVAVIGVRCTDGSPAPDHWIEPAHGDPEEGADGQHRPEEDLHRSSPGQ